MSSFSFPRANWSNVERVRIRGTANTNKRERLQTTGQKYREGQVSRFPSEAARGSLQLGAGQQPILHPALTRLRPNGLARVRREQREHGTLEQQPRHCRQRGQRGEIHSAHGGQMAKSTCPPDWNLRSTGCCLTDRNCTPGSNLLYGFFTRCHSWKSQEKRQTELSLGSRSCSAKSVSPEN
jgi:hypothetical protein